MGSLLNKLRMMDAEPKRSPAAKQEEHSEYYHNCATFPLSLFAERSYASQAVLNTVFRSNFPNDPKPDDILFLDTETTGLSGGAGTLAFEIGIGYFTASTFVVEQFLIHNYAEESAMLRALNAIMKRFSILCTFNGRTFDVPLLKNRFVMNRIHDFAIPNFHADVLYPARRLWKLRLQKCSLGYLEEQLLNVQREDDLPGALVPQTYFQYLKDGCFSPLQKVLEHNQQDIVSLAQLFYFMCFQFANPEAVSNSDDLFAMAKALEKQGAHEGAVKCYRLSAANGSSSRAFLSMARLEKRSGRYQAAISLYQMVLEQNPSDYDACEALAKLYEYKLHDIPGALGYTRQALLLLSEPSLFYGETVQERRIALQYRYARLRRKLSAADYH